ncbi:MAG: hypothetical protein P8M49_14380 [Thalassotalea sp.]|nr:hypothetical protein [Thalassotalea sp.]MDG2394698.1 hypothetical protein [Thalassotalea sp.]
MEINIYQHGDNSTNRLRLTISMLCKYIFSSLLFFTSIAACHPPNKGDLPTISINEFKYAGAYRLPNKTFGESSLVYASGVITYNQPNNSLFIIGKKKHQAIAEFPIPTLGQSKSLTNLPISLSPIQPFVRVLPKGKQLNPQNLNRITGIGVVDEGLFLNALKYYDAKGQNTDTSIFLPRLDNLKHKNESPIYALEGAAHAAGWISEIPQPWSSIFQSKLLVGNASNTPIASRHSIGPSAFVVDTSQRISTSKYIETKALIDFSLKHKLHEDTYNEKGDNDVWTVISHANYGFIVPNTSTYAVFGSSGGHYSQIGYKITQSNGHKCGGPCAEDPADYYNFYWLFDVNDMVKVFQGKKSPFDILPYEYGRLKIPFETSKTANGGLNFHRISGAAFDKHSKTLYFSLSNADNTTITKPVPLIIAYKLINQ